MFSHKKSTKEQIRANDREIRSAKRDLNRERADLDKEEKRLETEIKRLALKGDKQGCATLAKQLINVRKHRQRMLGFDSHLTALSSQQKVAASTVTMGQVMGSTTGIVKQINKNMDSLNLPKTLQEFQKAQSQIEMKEEMLNDMMDDVEVDNEADDVVQRVLHELNIDTKTQLDRVQIPQGSVSVNDVASMDDLEQQLARLRE